MRVLYVEDNFDNYKLVEFILSKHGFSVMNAVDGLDAIDKAEQYKPDFILMDINLPNLKGLEAATLLKSKPSTKHIPIVVLTAVYEPEYKKMAEKIGCVGYFTKPIDPISFPHDLKKILENINFESTIDPLVAEISSSLEEKVKKLVSVDKELRKTETRFNLIVESSLDPILIVDSDMYLSYANSAAMGYQFIRDSYKKLFDLNIIFNNSDEFLGEIRKIGHLKNYKFRLDENIFLGNFVFYDGELYIFLKDLTEIENMVKREKELDNITLIGRIASGVIHELNNPISAIKTYIDIYSSKIKMSEVKDTVVDEFSEKMKGALNRILDLVSNLTFFVKGSGESPTKLNINNVIKELLSFAEYDIRRGNVKLNIDLAENLNLIYGVKRDIQQTIFNILLNANDAVSSVSNPEITIKTYELDNYCAISIKDNGGGIPEEIKDKIFDPFFTTKNDERATGLGLTIVKKVVLNHKGELRIFTSENGTEFVLLFPKLQMDNG